MTQLGPTGSQLRRAQTLTTLLGERIKSRLAGYTIALELHPATVSASQNTRTAVVVPLDPGRLEIVAWVEPNTSETAEWVDYLAEVRVVLRSSELDGAIVEMYGASIELDDEDISADEVLTLAAQLLEDELRASLGNLEPEAALGAQLALRIYDNDPFA